MKFQNPTFKQGLNLTVRRGVKFIKNETEFGNLYYDSKNTDSPLGFMFINETTYMRFCDINESDLENEHDIDCRTPSGLKEKMQSLYPGFNENEIVTLVTFTVESFEIKFSGIAKTIITHTRQE